MIREALKRLNGVQCPEQRRQSFCNIVAAVYLGLTRDRRVRQEPDVVPVDRRARDVAADRVEPGEST